MWSPKSTLSNFLVGRFEAKEENEINVGYSSWRAVAECIRCNKAVYPDPIPIASRKYIASLIATIHDNRGAYHFRSEFEAKYSKLTEKPSDMFIYFRRPDMPTVDGTAIMSNSILTLSFNGGTPTTDRLFNSFETLTLLGVLSASKAELIPLLPYQNIVPWHDILVWIDFDSISTSIDPTMPIRALLDETTIQKHLNLMMKYKNDILWCRNDSRAVFNLLNSAFVKLAAASK